MKKQIMTIAILLGLATTTFADPKQGGGLFQRGFISDEEYSDENGYSNGPKPLLPAHGESTNQGAPLGGGIGVLVGLGAAYLVGKKRKEE